MAKVDALKEQIALIEGKLRFFRNAILAISSGLVWSGSCDLGSHFYTDQIVGSQRDVAD